MKLICVFSTLSAPVEYTRWKQGGNNVPIADGSVTIKGGAGVANQNIVTPRGVATMVTPDQLEILRSSPVFKLHEANGYVAVEEVDRAPGESDVENAAAAMEGRDVSAPMVAEDYTAHGEKAPTAAGTTVQTPAPTGRGRRAK